MGEIAADPEILAEAKALAGPLARAVEPCGEEAVKSALAPLVLVYGLGDQAKAQAFWRVYLKALSSLPAQALAQAVQDYADAPDSLFFPKPGPLRALANRRADPMRMAANRARRALSLQAKPPRAAPTTEERKRVRAMAAELGRAKAVEMGR